MYRYAKCQQIQQSLVRERPLDFQGGGWVFQSGQNLFFCHFQGIMRIMRVYVPLASARIYLFDDCAYMAGIQTL